MYNNLVFMKNLNFIPPGCPDGKVKTQKLLPKMDKGGSFFIKINKVYKEKYFSPMC